MAYKRDLAVNLRKQGVVLPANTNHLAPCGFGSIVYMVPIMPATDKRELEDRIFEATGEDSVSTKSRDDSMAYRAIDQNEW